jgi:hypothetical protein
MLKQKTVLQFSAWCLNKQLAMSASLTGCFYSKHMIINEKLDCWAFIDGRAVAAALSQMDAMSTPPLIL